MSKKAVVHGTLHLYRHRMPANELIDLYAALKLNFCGVSFTTAGFNPTPFAIATYTLVEKRSEVIKWAAIAKFCLVLRRPELGVANFIQFAKTCLG